ncbi:MAG: mevalonate kinase [Kiritimatiellae bacterium]|nr:mevalonate kinase [Kiritimatiellia bacterium]
MEAIALGKLILSGEHAVVHGRPALVMAVNRYVKAGITPQNQRCVTVKFAKRNHQKVSTLSSLSSFKQKVDEKYKAFEKGHLLIRDVIEDPLDLILYTIATALEIWNVEPDKGFELQLRSTIPLGCGMGSSAAAILATLKVLSSHFDVSVKADKLYQLALESEKIQHGRPSGVDPYISLHGGFVLFQKEKAIPLNISPMELFLINTGIPDATTGECVVTVSERFKENKIWNEFEDVTLRLEKALHLNVQKDVRALIRKNHRLLCRIGVVPNKVAHVIDEIEAEGGAAKVCGAGSTQGDQAGIVMVMSDKPPDAICQKYKYTMMTVQGDARGTRIV